MGLDWSSPGSASYIRIASATTAIRINPSIYI